MKFQTPLHQPTGTHLLLDASGCDSAALNDPDAMAHILTHAARAAGATPLHIIKEKFEPQGVSVAVLLSESHITVHTYPEFGTFMLDLFTCGDDCKPKDAIPFLLEALAPARHTVRIESRGFSDLEN